MTTPPVNRSSLSMLAIPLGIGGVIAFLGQAIIQLSHRMIEAMSMELSPVHWAFAIGWTLFMAYSEGYRGFQLRFAPRVVARAWHLRSHPRPLHVLVAPVFCMGYFHASRKRVLLTWGHTEKIVCIVAFVRLLSQPWRGLVDLGVVVGLSWGCIAILAGTIRAAQRGTEVDPQLPDPKA
ncbi:MAG: hypothetical protein VX498_06920 [Myxococcota bacterium]|nr:hypothetical protein [Myxococcota bacterium]